MEEQLWKKTFAWTGALLGASVVWVALVCLGSLLVVGRALPSSTDITSPATPGSKPASSEPPSGPGHAPEATTLKSRNG